MISKFKSICLVVPVLAALPTPAFAYERLPDGLARMTPSAFAERVVVSDDPLETFVLLSTRDGYKRSRALDGAQATDVYLQARIERKTGKVSWRVWHELSYPGVRRNFTAVHYQSAGHLQRSDALKFEHWLDDCPPTDGIGNCNQVARIGFDLPTQIIREIAASYREGERMPWRLRFKDEQGRDVTGGLAPAEVAGLAKAVEAWRSANT